MIRRPPRSTQTRSSAASDVYKRQLTNRVVNSIAIDPKLPTRLYVGTNAGLFRSTNSGTTWAKVSFPVVLTGGKRVGDLVVCLLYTSDAADDLLCVDLGGGRIIKKK